MKKGFITPQLIAFILVMFTGVIVLLLVKVKSPGLISNVNRQVQMQPSPQINSLGNEVQNSQQFNFKNSVIFAEQLKNEKSGYYDSSSFQLVLVDINSGIKKVVKKISIPYDTEVGSPSSPHPLFSPDKTHIIYAENYNLQLINENDPLNSVAITKEGRPKSDKYHSVDVTPISWSPDSSKFAYRVNIVRPFFECNVGPCDETKKEIAKSEEKTKVTESDLNIKEGLYVMDKNGKNQKYLGNRNDVSFTSYWGLDSQTLIVSKFDEGKREFQTLKKQFYKTEDLQIFRFLIQVRLLHMVQQIIGKI